MTRIVVEIKKCDKCPFVESSRTVGAGFALDYFCTKMRSPETGEMKKIAGYVEWDREMPTVPDWCPVKLD